MVPNARKVAGGPNSGDLGGADLTCKLSGCFRRTVTLERTGACITSQPAASMGDGHKPVLLSRRQAVHVITDACRRVREAAVYRPHRRPTDRPITLQIFGRLFDIVGNHPCGRALAGSAHGDVGELPAAAVSQEVTRSIVAP